jgi:hypothetical protein
MSRFSYAMLVATSMLSMSAAMADEVSRSSTTRTDSPGYNSSSNSTTVTEDRPTSVTTESSSSQTSPYGQEVSTKKTYKSAPSPRSTTTHRETTINR